MALCRLGVLAVAWRNATRGRWAEAVNRSQIVPEIASQVPSWRGFRSLNSCIQNAFTPGTARVCPKSFLKDAFPVMTKSLLQIHNTSSMRLAPSKIVRFQPTVPTSSRGNAGESWAQRAQRQVCREFNLHQALGIRRTPIHFLLMVNPGISSGLRFTNENIPLLSDIHSRSWSDIETGQSEGIGAWVTHIISEA